MDKNGTEVCHFDPQAGRNPYSEPLIQPLVGKNKAAVINRAWLLTSDLGFYWTVWGASRLAIARNDMGGNLAERRGSSWKSDDLTNDLFTICYHWIAFFAGVGYNSQVDFSPLHFNIKIPSTASTAGRGLPLPHARNLVNIRGGWLDLKREKAPQNSILILTPGIQLPITNYQLSIINYQWDARSLGNLTKWGSGVKNMNWNDRFG